ncbi:MAG: response regulator [Campylobacterales bacterium]|nr:response regulator [Campylobacterales bacterium]
MIDQKVLLVDDSKMIRRILKRSFLTLGIAEENISEAGDGIEALEMLMLDDPDKLSVIVTDIVMPNMDGVTLVKKIRNSSEYATAHIIVLSSIAREDKIHEFDGYKVDAFLKKPFDQQRFEKIVVPILQQSAALQSVQDHFREQVTSVDTTGQRVIFGENFLHECLKDVDKDSDVIEILQEVLTKNLHLAPKDIINITDTQIIIDKFIDKEREKKKVIKEIRKKLSINNEKEKEEEFITKMMTEFLEGELDLREIEHLPFVLHHQEIILELILAYLLKEHQLERKGAVLYSNMIVLKYKRFIYDMIADKFMFWLGKNNQSILSLIGKYSGGIKVINGIKYKIPMILDKDGKRIQVKDIVLVANRLVQTQISIDKSKNTIDENKKEILPLETMLESKQQELDKLLSSGVIEDPKQVEKLEMGIRDTKREISILTDKYKAEERKMGPNVTLYNEITPRYITMKEYIRRVLLTEFEVTDPGKWYEKEYVDDNKEVISEEKMRKLSGANREMTIKMVLSDRDVFEYKIINKAMVEILEPPVFDHIEHILTQTKDREKLSFKYMTNFDLFSMKNFINPLTTIFLGEFKKFLNDMYLNELSLAKEIYNKRFNQQIIRKIAIKIIHKYKKHIASMIADTFVDSLGEFKLEDVEYVKKPVTKMIESAITGNEKHQSILLAPDNTLSATSLHPIWVRVKQAEKVRNQEIRVKREDLIMYKSKEDGYQASIDALKKAVDYTLDDIETWNHAKLRDITVNDEDECKEEKRIIQYLPSGELTDTLRSRAEKGKLAAVSDIAKEEYERTFKFMELLHANNTQKTLDYKLQELEEYHKKSGKLAEKAKEDFDKEEKKKLYQYDETLNIIYKSLIYNFILTLKSEALTDNH